MVPARLLAKTFIESTACRLHPGQRGDDVVPEGLERLDLVHVHLVAGLVGRLAASQSNGDVFAIGFLAYPGAAGRGALLDGMEQAGAEEPTLVIALVDLEIAGAEAEDLPALRQLADLRHPVAGE